jgi:hypothetical protein
VFELLQSHRDVENGYAWIDLESGARTEDKFDIDKVLSILDKVDKIVKEN